ncbi:hypothetical protein [Dyella japonica]|uniref:DUF2946 domain-containing protein n=1 Tax=Dyella japonica TaxID=231455 RepID=A0ABV2JQX1_9GAMM
MRGSPRAAYLVPLDWTRVQLRYAWQVMRMRLHISRRRRVLWTGVVLFCLLFQQLAMAAYVCTLPTRPADTVMTGDCASMGMTAAAKASFQHQNPDARCAEHCAGDAASAHDVRLPSVPALLLPPASPTLMGTIMHAPDQAPLPDVALHRPEPPPTLRFCSLLI